MCLPRNSGAHGLRRSVAGPGRGPVAGASRQDARGRLNQGNAEKPGEGAVSLPGHTEPESVSGTGGGEGLRENDTGV